MVKASRRQLAVLGILMAVGAVSLYRGLRARPDAARHVETGGGGDAGSIEDVPAIGLDRLEALRRATPDEAEDAVARALSAARFPLTPPPPPPPVASNISAAPGEAGAGALPAMNVRFLGAVQAREGVWVAALLTDRKELLTGKEGDTVGNRFRIVKIGIESIDLVDVTSGRQRRVRLGGA